MRKKIKNKYVGTGLVFTLVITFLLVVLALGIAGVALLDRRSSLATDDSTLALQRADTASEILSSMVRYGASAEIIDNFSSILNGSEIGSGFSCGNGIIASPNYTISFKDLSQDIIGSCDSSLGQISEIKIAAKAGRVTRAIEVPITNFQTEIMEYNSGRDEDLISYWKFDDNATGNLLNSSYHSSWKLKLEGLGSLDNNTKRAGAAAINLTGGYLWTDSAVKLELPDNELTVEAWVYIPDFFSTDRTIVNKENTFKLFITADRQIGFSVFSDDGAISTARSERVVPIDAWTHVSGTVKADQIKAFINGFVPATATTRSNTSVNDISSDIFIGSAGPDTLPSNSRIDEVAIYGRALNHAEIFAHAH